MPDNPAQSLKTLVELIQEQNAQLRQTPQGASQPEMRRPRQAEAGRRERPRRAAPGNQSFQKRHPSVGTAAENLGSAVGAIIPEVGQIVGLIKNVKGIVDAFSEFREAMQAWRMPAVADVQPKRKPAPSMEAVEEDAPIPAPMAAKKPKPSQEPEPAKTARHPDLEALRKQYGYAEGSPEFESIERTFMANFPAPPPSGKQRPQPIENTESPLPLAAQGGSGGTIGNSLEHKIAELIDLTHKQIDLLAERLPQPDEDETRDVETIPADEPRYVEKPPPPSKAEKPEIFTTKKPAGEKDEKDEKGPISKIFDFILQEGVEAILGVFGL